MRTVLTVLTVLAAGAVIWALGRDLLPPKTLRFAAGGEGGGYWTIAGGYRTALDRDGIDVTVIETSGSVENARRLADGRADVALIQGGIAVPPGTESLGALFYEPMFFFARRSDAIPRNPARWRGLRIARGGDGSGTAAAFAMLRQSAGLTQQDINGLEAGGADAAAALIAGEADIAVFVAPITAPYLTGLFGDARFEIIPLDHITALSRRLDQTHVIVLPSGAVSIDPPRPEADVVLLGMIAHLVARQDLHPSLVDRMVEAARALHSRPNPITLPQQFPSAEAGGLAMNAYAAKLIREGPSALQQYLPYWVVAQINRFAILLLPVLIFLVPLFRVVPGLYAWRMRMRVYRYYTEIREIDTEAQSTDRPEVLEALRNRLAETDREIASLSLPPPYRDRAYTAHVHIDLVRQRIEDRIAALAAPAPAPDTRGPVNAHV